MNISIGRGSILAIQIHSFECYRAINSTGRRLTYLHLADTITTMVHYNIQTNGQLRPHLEQEWLLTNGTGSFASGTLVGCNTRRYHGLLVAAIHPPVGRIMTVNRIGEVLSYQDRPDRPLAFSINQFDQQFHPRGEQYLQRCTIGDIAEFHYDVEGTRILKQVLLVWKRNITLVRYQVTPAQGRAVELRLSPFVSLRDFHAMRHVQGTAFRVASQRDGVDVSLDKLHVALQSTDAFVAKPDWWYSHTYAIETERGLDDHEDLFTPGHFVLRCNRSAEITVQISTEDESALLDFDEERALIPSETDSLQQAHRSIAQVSVSKELNASKQQGAASAAVCLAEEEPSETIRRLLHAARDFVVARQAPDGSAGSTILAGYPWFADWGRDTMIALPGILLCSGRFDEAKQVLSLFAQYVSQGMIPNRFDDYTNEPSYNTVDASLWFIHAVHAYLHTTGDRETYEAVLRPACSAIIEGYRQGTRYKIQMDPADGLIRQGDGDTQLTWMDAKNGGIAFTPRQGKPVEINALWYNALRYMGLDELAERVAQSFRKAFWISPFRGLADVVNEGHRDTSIRPNQIFAVGLPYSPLTPEQQSAVVEVVQRELLTPMGLRTLAQDDPKFHSTYRGTQMLRDEAYHNGTIWAWPMGGFIDAYLRVNHQSAEAIEQAQRWLTPLIQTMSDRTIGQIAEIFEAQPPHRPVGCPAQAWSVAEILRASTCSACGEQTCGRQLRNRH